MAHRKGSKINLPTPLPEFRNLEYIDYSVPDNRKRFEGILEKVRSSFPIDAPLVIDGKRVETRQKIAVTSPSDTSLVIGRSSSAGPKHVDEAIKAARKAFESWRQTTPGERAALLLRVAERCRQEREELAALEVYEAAKPWNEADADVCEAVDFLEFYAREMLRLGEPQLLQTYLHGERNELFYDPLGVVGVIGPWNFPMAIPTGMMSAAVVTGNTVLWKPSRQTPIVTYRVLEIFEECGMPKGVVNFLPGPGSVIGERLVSSPDVEMIAFTGSRDVGVHILNECTVPRRGSDHVKRAVAEMGGKNGLILDDDTDLDVAMPFIIKSAFGFSGQKCSALSRLIVHQKLHKEVVKRLAKGMEGLKVAPAWDPECNINAVIDADARQKIESYLKIGAKEGAVIFQGDVGSLGEQGHFVPPAAFDGIEATHRLAQEEVFGPVVAVMKARTFDEALEIANATQYALTGGAFSGKRANLEKAKRHYRCGNLYLNRGITGSIVARQPFGGFKMSGIGSKAGGPDYLRQFLVARTATENLLY